jgi:cyclopropane-fatty-acyl-phospholipid synthase
MNDTTLVSGGRGAARARSPIDSLARRLLFARLAQLGRGVLRVRDGGRTYLFGAERTGVEATIDVLDPAFHVDATFGGSVGAGESYMAGRWRSDDLTALMRLMIDNRETLDGMEAGLARISAPLRRAAHWLHRNTRGGARRNIAAHYDAGNDFFALVLDETMMYSCALFERPGMSLAEASVAKLDAVCRRLALGPADHVLEIGTGWGGFALHAARTTGCRVTTTTISRSQYELARERVREAGLDGRVTVLLEDYRDVAGTYDKLVSIEMIEAIGHRQFEEFFRRCAARLVPGGRMLLQSITIADERYAAARDDVDFIKRYVFPGCCIPSVGALVAAMESASDLRVVRIDEIGPHYATTLARWRENLLRNVDAVRALGYPDSFIRMWEFYLCYCEAGFAARALGDVQMLVARPGPIRPRPDQRLCEEPQP